MVKTPIIIFILPSASWVVGPVFTPTWPVLPYLPCHVPYVGGFSGSAGVRAPKKITASSLLLVTAYIHTYSHLRGFGTLLGCAVRLSILSFPRPFGSLLSCCVLCAALRTMFATRVIRSRRTAAVPSSQGVGIEAPWPSHLASSDTFTPRPGGDHHIT